MLNGKMLLRYVIYFSNMHVCFISWLTMCIITYGFYLQHGMIRRWSLGYKMAPQVTMRRGWNRLRRKSKVGWFRVLKEDWICANRCCSDLGGLAE